MSLNNEIKINIIGDIYCDIVASNLESLPSWGGDVLSKGISILPGGSCLNTTLHMANYIKWYEDQSQGKYIKVYIFIIIQCI
jgi:hypothetical protein